MTRRLRKDWIGDIMHRFETVEDPYLAEQKRSGTGICPRCHAVFRNKRWRLDEKFYAEHKDDPAIPKFLCPGCRRALDHYPGGYLMLQGSFLREHEDEIMRVLNNEYERARGKNPLEQIIDIKDEPDGSLTVETTNERLAQRLGRAIYKAYKGELTFNWSHMNKMVRVYWKRGS